MSSKILQLALFFFYSLLLYARIATSQSFEKEIANNVSFGNGSSGVMVTFSSSVINSKLSEPWDDSGKKVAWCGNSNRTIFIMARSGSFYKSSDNGATWTNIYEKVPLARHSDVIY